MQQSRTGSAAVVIMVMVNLTRRRTPPGEEPRQVKNPARRRTPPSEKPCNEKNPTRRRTPPSEEPRQVRNPATRRTPPGEEPRQVKCREPGVCKIVSKFCDVEELERL